MGWIKYRSKQLLTSLYHFVGKLTAFYDRVYHWLDPRNYHGHKKILHSIGLIAGVTAIILSFLIPIVNIYLVRSHYSLSEPTTKLIGSVNQNLVKQITYDNQKRAYIFNAPALIAMDSSSTPNDVANALMQSKIGSSSSDSKSKSPYAVELPTDPKQGITYFDANTQLSFKLIPEFEEQDAKQVEGRIIYPRAKGIQTIYTVKGNGLKEDLVLQKPVSDSLTYSYKLQLPKTLEARMLNDGSGALGIYSADPALYGKIAYGDNSMDKSAIETAKTSSPKNNLVFALPAPYIKQTGVAGQGRATAKFILNKDKSTLTVSTNKLMKLSYPITIDPSVVVTSTTDFATGNNEGNIDFPAGQINRGALTGGGLNTTSGSWTATTSLPAVSYYSTSVAYNGYVYQLGGTSGSAVNYAPLNSDGTIGTWNPTTSLSVAPQSATTVTYNGYIYVIGGNASGLTTTVYYTAINSNGTLGTWLTTTQLPTATSQATSVVYNGYLYLIGGNTGSNTANVYYAKFNANGTIGSWTSTTSLSTATSQATSVVYNGYIYQIGGNTGSASANVFYSKINSDGSIGSWTATTALPVARFAATSVVYNGYIYQIGGNTGSASATVYYAPINANGSIGPWTTSTSLTNATYGSTSVAYSGYVYEIGGFTTAATAVVSYAKIDPAGATTNYTTNTNSLPTATSDLDTIAYNGYMYAIGGFTTTYVSTVSYAAINSDGSLGTWAATTSLPTAVSNATAVAYNGYMYSLGGLTPGLTAAVNYAVINANGTLGSWTATTSLPAATSSASSAVYNGYIYEVGGNSGATTAAVYYAQLNSNGTVGTWTSTTALPSATQNSQTVISGGYIYEIGGAPNAIGGLTAVVSYAPINSNGTIGSWTATTSLPAATEYSSAVVYNGYVYVMGGAYCFICHNCFKRSY